MSNSRTICVLAIGVVIGALGTGPVGALQAPRSPTRNQANPRLLFTEATKANFTSDRLFFIKDAQSTGCWLAIYNENRVSLAEAPAEACPEKGTESPSSTLPR